MNILAQAPIDPVETAAFLKLYENKTKYLQDKKRTICDNLKSSYCPTTKQYADEQPYIEYIMQWEERCADILGMHVVNILKEALNISTN